MVQRIGPLAPGAVRDRWGPFVEPATIAADLRAGVDARLSDLDRAEGRMRYDELDRIAGSAERGAAELDSRAGAQGRRPPRPAGPRTSTRTRWSSAGTSCAAAAATPGATPTGSRPSWPPTTGRCRPWRTWSGPGGGPADQRRRLAAARRELVAARGDVDPALRSRLRLAAATTRGAYLRGLPRADYGRGRDRGSGAGAGGVLPRRSVDPQRDLGRLLGRGSGPPPAPRAEPHVELPPRRHSGPGRSQGPHPVDPQGGPTS